jgi:hypothetical protein
MQLLRFLSVVILPSLFIISGAAMELRGSSRQKNTENKGEQQNKLSSIEAICFNTDAGYGADEGCTPSKPFCVGFLSDTSTAVPVGDSGVSCQADEIRSTSSTLTLCKNTENGGEIDRGCSIEEPICVGLEGERIQDDAYGKNCVPCVNAFQALGSTDFGCPDSAPRCALLDDVNPELNYAGEKCITPIASMISQHRFQITTAYRQITLFVE